VNGPVGILTAVRFNDFSQCTCFGLKLEIATAGAFRLVTHFLRRQSHLSIYR
jgi:hypothetical protein